MSNSAASVELPSSLSSLQKVGIALAVLAGGATVAGAFVAPDHFYKAYLVGYLFWIGIAAGSFAVVMLHHLTAGAWGFSVQRIMESGSRTLPLMALLFIPLLFGLDELYMWARPEVVAGDRILQSKEPYLNVPFFVVRAAIYFGVWVLMAALLNRWSRRQDDSNGNTSFTHRMVVLSGPGIVLFVLTMTFAAFDWVMSLEPHWFSTIFGLLLIVGQGLSTFAFGIVILAMLASHKPLSDYADADKFHDLGKLLLGFTMLWGYIMLSQYLIIWSGNIPEEVTWYLHRSSHGWGALSAALVLLHFFVPFFVLLTRHTKRRPQVLATIAIFILAMRLLDIFWLVVPSEHHPELSFHWLYVATVLGVGGLWLTVFVWQLKTRPLLPMGDPRFEEAMHGSH